MRCEHLMEREEYGMCKITALPCPHFGRMAFVETYSRINDRCFFAEWVIENVK
jgi:hypothetical protein